MAFSIRLTEAERAIANSYAKLHSVSLGEAFKNALFEKIEDEYDITVAAEAYQEYVSTGKKSRPFSELKKDRVETTARFDKEFKKLDKYTQRMIAAWIDKNLEGSENPRVHGKGLTANRSGQWRYRIGDYRLICAIQDNELVILALTVGHRRTVYDQ